LQSGRIRRLITWAATAPPQLENTVDILVFLLALIYFLPTAMAAHGRRLSVFIVNLGLGWTLILWPFILAAALHRPAYVRGTYERE
jgi:hypothetical protein